MPTVYLSPIFNGWQGFNANGQTLNGGFINSYVAGSATPQDTYTTIAGSVKNSNPIVLGSDGRPPQEIWLVAGQSYKFILTDSLGNVQKTYDDITNDAGLLAVNLANTSNTALGDALVGVKLNLSNTAARTQHDKNADSINILDFVGAVADGVIATGAGTDNSTAFQNAINAIGSGGTLTLPAGVFKLSSQIVVPNNFTIRGAGNYSTVLMAPTSFNNATGLVHLSSGGGAPTNIMDLAITGQLGGAGAVSKGLVSNSNGSILTNLWVASFACNVQIADTDNFMLNCILEEALAGGTGLLITAPGVSVIGGEIYNCYVGALVSAVATLDSPIIFDSVRSVQCTYSGFTIDSSSYVKLNGCSATSPSAATKYTLGGVTILASSHISVSDFMGVLGAGPSAAAYGIGSFTSSTDVSITGSTLTGWYDGISVDSTYGAVITDNISSSNKRRGISVVSGDKVIIGNNTCHDNSGAGVTDAGIYADNSAVFADYTLIGNSCVETGGGSQDYGIYTSLTDNAGSTGRTTIVGNTCLYNAVANWSINGKTDYIQCGTNTPDPYLVTAVYDPPNLAAAAGATTTIAFALALMGDIVTVSFSLDLQGISLTGYVSVAGTISVRFQNGTAGALDLGSGTLTARISRAY